MAIFKLALLAIGAAIGAYWYNFFGGYLIVLIVAGLIAGLYITFVSFRQQGI
jgi:fatty acid desaturase